MGWNDFFSLSQFFTWPSAPRVVSTQLLTSLAEFSKKKKKNHVHPPMHWSCLEISSLCTLESVIKFVASLPTLPVSLADPLHAWTVGRGGVSLKWSQECSSQTKRSSFHGKEALGSNSCQFPKNFAAKRQIPFTCICPWFWDHGNLRSLRPKKPQNGCGLKQSEWLWVLSLWNGDTNAPPSALILLDLMLWEKSSKVKWAAGFFFSSKK